MRWFILLAFCLELHYAKICRWNKRWAVLGPEANRSVTASITSLDLSVPGKPGFNISKCTFLAYSDAFPSLIDTSSLKTLAQRDYPFAHEAGVYIPSMDAVFFTSNRYVQASMQHLN